MPVNVDSLIYEREQARKNNDYGLSDTIREKLDALSVFVLDTKGGQVVYHELVGTRKDLEEKLTREARADKIFDAWLFSHKQ